MQLTLQDIIRMMGNPSTGVMSDADVARFKQQQIEKEMMQPIKQMLSLPAAENMPNYANNEMPLYTGGLLQNPQGNMVDPQQLLNTAYDMSAPREMRINAIERLRALGIQ
jgi:hypothetical protein